MSSEDNHIRIFDTTLRDGNQAVGIGFSLADKSSKSKAGNDSRETSSLHRERVFREPRVFEISEEEQKDHAALIEKLDDALWSKN